MENKKETVIPSPSGEALGHGTAAESEEKAGKGKKSKKADQDPKKKKTRKKIIICVVFVVLAAIAALYFFVLKDMDEEVLAERFLSIFKQEDTRTRYLFNSADYSEDIFTDKVYMDLNRYISFESNGVAILITDENYSDYGEDAEFFGEYFSCVISGDAEGYNELFSEKYYKLNEPVERFTMQKVYDIHVERQSSESKNGYSLYYYKVSFKIRRNNGTLFRDRDSDSSKPLAFILTDREGGLKIDRIIEYEYK